MANYMKYFLRTQIKSMLYFWFCLNVFYCPVIVIIVSKGTMSSVKYHMTSCVVPGFHLTMSTTDIIYWTQWGLQVNTTTSEQSN